MFHSTVSLKDLKRFEAGTYYSSSIINFYMKLLEKVSLLAHESYAFTKERGKKSAQLREPKKVKFFNTSMTPLLEEPGRRKEVERELEDFFE